MIYDGENTPGAALNAVDNVTVSPFGDVYVCEDGGNMEICLISPDRVVSPFVPARRRRPSELGDDGRRVRPVGHAHVLQLAALVSVRCPGTPSDASILARGATYEVTGPFRLPAGGVPESWVYGPPAGERAGVPGLGDVPGLGLSAVRIGSARVRASVTTDRPAKLHAVLRTFDLKSKSRGDGTHDRPLPVTLAQWSGSVARRSTRLSLAPSRLAPSAVLTVVAERDDGTRRVVAQTLKLS